MVTGEACGKVILFGEHFVVHGSSAIAAGISSSCIVEINRSAEISFLGPKGTSRELSKKSISNILNAMEISEKYSVSYGGDLPIFGGLGSSAAFCVAVVRAIANDHGLTLTKEQINAYAYEGERAFHGNPSGIDNTVATYGGVMCYVRGRTPSESSFESIKIGKRLHIVLGVTGIFGPTSAMISKVAIFKENNSEKFNQLMVKMQVIIEEAKKAIALGDVNKIGLLMDENQKLLLDVGVSIELNNKLVEIMKQAGALGAKITGGGGGGCCIAIAQNEKHAQQILLEIKKAGFDGFYTEISRVNLKNSTQSIQ